MRRCVTFLIIIISMITYPFAYPARPTQDEAFQDNTSVRSQQSIPTSGMAPRMSNVVDMLLINANTLQLTDKQRESLSRIPEKYVYPLRRIEADYDIARMKINSLMQDPEFDTTQAKEETKILQETALEMSYMSIEAIAEIRNIVGLENFKKILSLTKKIKINNKTI